MLGGFSPFRNAVYSLEPLLPPKNPLMDMYYNLHLPKRHIECYGLLFKPITSVYEIRRH